MFRSGSFSDQDGEIAGALTMNQGTSIGDTGVDDVRDGGIRPGSLVATKGGKTSEQAVILGALSWLGVASIAAEVKSISVVLDSDDEMKLVRQFLHLDAIFRRRGAAAVSANAVIDDDRRRSTVVIVAKDQVCLRTKREAVAPDHNMSNAITMDPGRKLSKDVTGGALPAAKIGEVFQRPVQEGLMDFAGSASDSARWCARDPGEGARRVGTFGECHGGIKRSRPGDGPEAFWGARRRLPFEQREPSGDKSVSASGCSWDSRLCRMRRSRIL